MFIFIKLDYVRIFFFLLKALWLTFFLLDLWPVLLFSCLVLGVGWIPSNRDSLTVPYLLVIVHIAFSSLPYSLCKQVIWHTNCRLNILWRPIDMVFSFRVYLLQGDGRALGRNDIIVINGVAWRGLGDPCPSLFSWSLTMNWEDYAPSHTTGIWLCYGTKLASSTYDRLDPQIMNHSNLSLCVSWSSQMFLWVDFSLSITTFQLFFIIWLEIRQYRSSDFFLKLSQVFFCELYAFTWVLY